MAIERQMTSGGQTLSRLSHPGFASMVSVVGARTSHPPAIILGPLGWGDHRGQPYTRAGLPHDRVPEPGHATEVPVTTFETTPSDPVSRGWEREPE
jgi:hypothetical protein